MADAPYRLDTTPAGTEVLETACVGGCPQPYRIDAMHPDYTTVRRFLDAGDRSTLRCYHGPVLDETSRQTTLRDSPAAKRKPR